MDKRLLVLSSSKGLTGIQMDGDAQLISIAAHAITSHPLEGQFSQLVGQCNYQGVTHSMIDTERIVEKASREMYQNSSKEFN